MPEVLRSHDLEPGGLAGVLNKEYSRFQRNIPSRVGLVYAGVDKASLLQAGLGRRGSPLLDMFSLSFRDEQMGLVERMAAAERMGELLTPFLDFEGIPGRSWFLMPRQIVEPHTRSQEVLDWVLLQKSVRNGARQKSLGIFYEHLAGIVALEDDVEPKGFNNNTAGYFELLTADFLHNRGRSLILQAINTSRLTDPPPDRFDRDYEKIEKYREREQARWSVLAVGDSIALEAWQRFLDSNPNQDRARNARSAVQRYAGLVLRSEKAKDISIGEARKNVNPFLAL